MAIRKLTSTNGPLHDVNDNARRQLCNRFTKKPTTTAQRNALDVAQLAVVQRTHLTPQKAERDTFIGDMSIVAASISERDICWQNTC